MQSKLSHTLKTTLKDKKFWISNLKTLALMFVIAFAITQYQQRSMVEGLAPSLAGVNYSEGPTLVYFWGSWCPICKTTSPFVSTLAADNDYQIHAIALSSGTDNEIERYMIKHGYQFPVINDDSGNISESWGVAVTPSIFVINQEGEISHTSTGMTSLWGMRFRLWLASL
jgi:thiol-disulfide isomerase/thioredoxin